MGYRTPNIDRIAKEGLMFTDYYAEQSCTAGRSSFITGQCTLRTGLSKVGVPAAPVGLQAKDPNVDARKFVEDWIETRYHAPSDDMQQPLNFDAAVQFMQINFLVGYDLAQQQERPTWKPGDFFGNLYAGK